MTPAAPKKVEAPAPVVDPTDVEGVLNRRGKTVHVFPVNHVFGLPGPVEYKIAMQILPGSEQKAARNAAHKTIAEDAKLGGAASEKISNDRDMFQMEQDLECLFRICKRVDAKGEPTQNAAFPGVGWLRETRTSDEIASLLNLYDELRTKHARVSLVIDDETIERVSGVLAEHVGDDIPQQFLSPYPKWWLTHYSVLVSAKLHDARKSVEILLAQQEAHNVEREAMEATISALQAQIAEMSAEKS